MIFLWEGHMTKGVVHPSMSESLGGDGKEKGLHGRESSVCKD